MPPIGPFLTQALAQAACASSSSGILNNCCPDESISSTLNLTFSVPSGTFACLDLTSINLVYSVISSSWEFADNLCVGYSEFSLRCISGIWNLQFNIETTEGGSCLGDLSPIETSCNPLYIEYVYFDTCFFGLLTMIIN